MKTTKRIISTILVVVMCLTMAPLNGFMEIKWEGSDFPEFDFSEIFTPEAKAASGYYAYSVSGGKAKITDVDGSISGDIAIPTTLGGYPVTSIGEYAFYYCNALTSVSIPDSVTSIGDSAFDDCYVLTSVTIPDSVTSIGNYAFYRCSALTSVTIPDSVTSIGERAFSFCDALTSIIVDENNSNYSSDANGVLFNKNRTTLIQYPAGSNKTAYTIPASVTTIESYAFYVCDALTSVTIPDSVTSIGSYAFAYCDALTSVSIPDSVTSIGYYAFGFCDALKSVTIGNSVTSIGECAFYLCSALTNVTIPDSVTSIGDSAFNCCYALTSVSIPDSVTSIGGGPFSCCDALTSIIVDENNSNYSSDVNGVLFNKNRTTLIQYPAGSNKIAYTIPDSVTSIGDSAFGGCSSLTSVSIPDSVTSIGYSAFVSCSALTSVTIPDSVTSIGDDAFCNCSALTSVTIPDSVTSIGYQAFIGCYALKSVTIPDSVTSIGEGAFAYCSALTSVSIPDSVTYIDDSAFEGCDKLTDVYYSGTQEQWQKISIYKENAPLLNATIHYNAYHIHRYNSEVTTTATHLKEGVMTYTCSCGDTYTEVIAKTTEHDYKAEVTAPTCVDKGYTTYTCACGAGYVDDYVKEKGHTYTSVITKKADCTNAGLKTYTCSVCKNSYTEDIPKLGHNFSKEFTVDKEATYTESGLKSKHCLRNGCSEKSEAVEIPRLVPVFTDSKDVKVNGNDILSNNGLTAAQLLSQAGKGAVIRTSDGKAVENTSLIGTGMILTMADGSKKEIVVYGDVDGNGKITAADARKALRASVSLEKYKETSAQYKAANVESKNKISASDARLILRASVGLEDAKKWMK